jgi:hypothetical protein
VSDSNTEDRRCRVHTLSEPAEKGWPSLYKKPPIPNTRVFLQKVDTDHDATLVFLGSNDHHQATVHGTVHVCMVPATDKEYGKVRTYAEQ